MIATVVSRYRDRRQVVVAIGKVGPLEASSFAGMKRIEACLANNQVNTANWNINAGLVSRIQGALQWLAKFC
jgi:hypothetical protein